MKFNDYKSITISKQGVSLDGQELSFDTQLPTNVDYVQFHAGRDFLIEEPSFNEVPLDSYNYIFGLYEQALANVQEEVSGTELQIAEAKDYLTDTDWIIVKISEMQMEGVDINILKEKYKEELINRTYYRNLINQLEGESNE